MQVHQGLFVFSSCFGLVSVVFIKGAIKSVVTTHGFLTALSGQCKTSETLILRHIK